jgi:hypothetical protein
MSGNHFLVYDLETLEDPVDSKDNNNTKEESYIKVLSELEVSNIEKDKTTPLTQI